MRFLVDAQLPPLLARHIREIGHEAEHVADIGMSASSDRDIWQYAHANDAILITKDEDFVTMRALRADGPAVVWIRLGNTTRRTLLTRFVAIQQVIFAALDRGETVIEVSGSVDE